MRHLVSEAKKAERGVVIPPDDAGVAVMPDVVAAPPRVLVDRELPPERPRCQLAGGVEVIVRAVENVMPDLADLEDLVQRQQRHAEREARWLEAGRDQDPSDDTAAPRDAPHPSHVGQVVLA